MSYVKTGSNKRRRLLDETSSSPVQPSQLSDAKSLDTTSTASQVVSTPLKSPAAPIVGQPLVVNNNHNTTHAPGGVVINYNPAETHVHMHDAYLSELAIIEKALKRRHVPRAVFDAAPPEAGCMEGTRVQLLADCKTILKKRGGAHMVWIAGMAGTGKTSIALTLCRLLSEESTVLLGGTFFCSRSAGVVELTDAQRIVPTLAMILARKLPAYAQTLAAELETDPDLSHKPVRIQVEHLLVRPLEGLKSLERQIVFVVDALDECTNEDIVTGLINAIADFDASLPVKFLFTSRPEMHIRDTSIADTSLSSIVQLHVIDEAVVTADIRLYIQATIEKFSPSSSAWYTEDDLEILVSLCGRLFISASTALAYILRRKDAPSRSDRLKTIKQQNSTSVIATAPLDKIYLLVLEQALDRETFEPTEINEIRRIIAVILATQAPLTVKALAELLAIPLEHLRGVLDELHAVVFVPDDDEGELRTLHASFGDFIYARAPDHLRIDQKLGHDELARVCLKRMEADDLCFNVSRSVTSHRGNPMAKPNWIARSLTYACLYWAHHINLASVRTGYGYEIGSILRVKFLFWLEVLSVLGEVGRASGILRTAASAVWSPDVYMFLRDANFFVTSSHEAIERSAPHIYLSALPFTSKNSLVHQTFSPMLTGLLSVETFGINRDGGQCVMVLPGHWNNVTDIVYSPDGTVLASGSDDGTVRLWDTRSGAERRDPLTSSRDDRIQSIAFTADGERLIAGTELGGILVWNIRTGRLLPPNIERHTDAIRGIAVSPGGKIMASASDDNTIGLWLVSNDWPTGLQPTGDLLCGHTSHVCAVSFSPDDSLLASCGYDHTIRIWDYRLGNPAREPLVGHREPVFSVAFSNDSSLLASGSEDTTVRVWDVQTSQQYRTYSGHQGWVTSVAFSPRDHRLASVSDDFTVRVWDVADERQDALFCLRGHSEPVYAICFSKDGRYVTSGSGDRKIRVWDVGGSSSACMPLDGHTDEVHAVAISRDGSFFASASKDGSTRVWDMQSCKLAYPPLLGHQGSVRSVAISLDNRWIATGSADTTLRLWDAKTGRLAMPVLSGHTSDVNVVAFSADNLYLVSGSDDHTLRVWEVGSERPAQVSPLQLDQSVCSIANSSNGQLVAVCDAGGDIRIFNAVGSQVKVFEGSYGSNKSSSSLIFSHDYTRVMTPAGKSIAYIEVCTGYQQLYDLGHTDYVNTVAYSELPATRLIASGADDWTIRLWDLNKAEALEPVLHGHAGDVLSVAFSSDGRFLVTGGSDKTVRLWNIAENRGLSEDKQNALNILALARYEEDGWLVLSSEDQGSWTVSPFTGLLLWVPPEYRGHLEIGGHSRLIATHRVIITANDGVVYQGEDWTRCWRSHNSVAR